MKTRQFFNMYLLYSDDWIDYDDDYSHCRKNSLTILCIFLFHIHETGLYSAILLEKHQIWCLANFLRASDCTDKMAMFWDVIQHNVLYIHAKMQTFRSDDLSFK